jgi:uncharacterized small protein (DUF1192 family)
MMSENKMEALIDSIHDTMEDNGGGHAILKAWESHIINLYKEEIDQLKAEVKKKKNRIGILNRSLRRLKKDK